ncbi:MAG: PilZ domain-containing protein [Deltaproteobacteria bacterium]|nr:PilZ domain-containing protein [Deltaproteobacteria bacterium]
MEYDDNPEIISGKGALTLLEQIKEARIAIQMIVLGKDYERLTLITGVRTVDGRRYLLVDCPVRFSEDVKDHEGARVKLEFLGKDRVQYAFRSSVCAVSDNDILLEFPGSIERIQRRQHFRIAPPLGTTLSFSRNGRLIEGSVINLSEGGALLSLHKQGEPKSRLWAGEDVRGLTLRCRAEKLTANLRIRKASVKREQREPQSGRLSYALQFLDMDPKEKNALRGFIFNCQREMLRRRSLIEEVR